MDRVISLGNHMPTKSSSTCIDANQDQKNGAHPHMWILDDTESHANNNNCVKQDMHALKNVFA